MSNKTKLDTNGCIAVLVQITVILALVWVIKELLEAIF